MGIRERMETSPSNPTTKTNFVVFHSGDFERKRKNVTAAKTAKDRMKNAVMNKLPTGLNPTYVESISEALAD